MTEARDRTAVIIQPCFFPWRGQFDLMSRADVVVFLDTVQYVRHGWYNRNRIVTAQGEQWITVPVQSTGSLATPIREVRVAEQRDWRRKLLATLDQAYARHPHYADYRDALHALLGAPWPLLAPLAEASVRWCFAQLGRAPRFVTASALGVDHADPVQRLVELCTAVGARRYLSGPAARAYIEAPTPFETAGIALEWMVYDYPDYPQLRASTLPLSVLDLLFNVGPAAPRYIWPAADPA